MGALCKDRGLSAWVAAAGLLLIGVVRVPAFAAGGDVYFIERGTSSISGLSLETLALGLQGLPAGDPSQADGSTDAILRTDSRGQATKTIAQPSGEHRPRAISVSPDGKRLFCQVVSTNSQSGESASHIVVLEPNGKVLKTIELAKFGVRAFGTPVMLPDKVHIGLTVCALGNKPAVGDKEAGQKNPPTQRARAAKGKARAEDNVAPARDGNVAANQISARGAWDEGAFPSQPFVATINLTGRNLKQIGPGAMPCWSPDGKSILYTAVSIVGPGVMQGLPRLNVMNADGAASHSVAAESTCEGWYSDDGKRIVYVSLPATVDHTSQIVIADADGSSAKPLELPTSIYGAPRWLSDGKTIALESRFEAEGKPGVPAATGEGRRGAFNAVWLASADGTDLRCVSHKDNNDSLRGCDLDADAETFLLHLTGLPGRMDELVLPGLPLMRLPAGAELVIPRIPLEPGLNIRPIPLGTTVEFDGARVFLRDANGKPLPIADGTYLLPTGDLLQVRDGKKVLN